jgi:hypothetical protein
LEKNMSEERKTHLTDATKVKVGDIMAIVHYVTVKSINKTADGMVVTPVDKLDQPISVQGVELITNALSADYFAEEVKSSMTEVAEILVSSHNRPLTVCFVKQPKKGEDEGETRVLRGRLLKHEALLGRSYVEDLEKADPKERVRLVDHRTLKYLIVDGVKYTVKGKR